MTTRTRLSVLLISTPLLAFIIVGGLRGNAAGGDPTFQHLRVFEDVVSLILNNYVETAKIDRVMEGAMRGMADGLDPDSSYLTPADVKAAKAGLQTGDYIRAIDGKPARDLSVFEGARMLRGEPGSKVKLTVIRGNAAEPRDFELVREKTPATLVSGKIL